MIDITSLKNNHNIISFEEFIMEKDDDLTLELLQSFILKHKQLVEQRYIPLKNMYLGDHQILHLEKKEMNKPDNRVVMNFAKYIVDTLNGYFLGIPIKINHENELVEEKFEQIHGFNNIDDEQYELSKDMSIYGIGYEMIFLDDNAIENIINVDPTETFIIRDNSIRKNIRYGVHYYTDTEGNLLGTFSDDAKIYYFEEKKGELIITEERAHYFGEVPIIEYRENEECQSAFESVYTLINEANKAISEKANDVDYFADAYMKVIGAELDENTLKNIRDMRVINLFTTSSELGNTPDVDFLGKPNADTTQENLLDRLEEKIYQLSMVPNLSDENFGTSSGIALSYKLQGLDNLCKTKERKFTASLNRRYRLLCNLPNAIDHDAWQNINYQFNRNMPKNVLEESQVVNTLNGLVSKETALSYLSIVDNAKAEIEKMNEEDNYENDLGDHAHPDNWTMQNLEFTDETSK